MRRRTCWTSASIPKASSSATRRRCRIGRSRGPPPPRPVAARRVRKRSVGCRSTRDSQYRLPRDERRMVRDLITIELSISPGGGIPGAAKLGFGFARTTAALSYRDRFRITRSRISAASTRRANALQRTARRFHAPARRPTHRAATFARVRRWTRVLATAVLAACRPPAPAWVGECQPEPGHAWVLARVVGTCPDRIENWVAPYGYEILQVLDGPHEGTRFVSGYYDPVEVRRPDRPPGSWRVVHVKLAPFAIPSAPDGRNACVGQVFAGEGFGEVAFHTYEEASTAYRSWCGRRAHQAPRVGSPQQRVVAWRSSAACRPAGDSGRRNVGGPATCVGAWGGARRELVAGRGIRQPGPERTESRDTDADERWREHRRQADGCQREHGGDRGGDAQARARLA
jgi:hypothetical protein